MKNQAITKVVKFHPLGTKDICTKFITIHHYKPAKNANLMMTLKKN